MIKVSDFLNVLGVTETEFEVYHKGQYVVGIWDDVNWLRTEYSWILDCIITEINVDNGILSIDTK